jgi:hypothetical protein
MDTPIAVTQADLTEALTSFRLAVRIGRGQESREIADPETVASVLHATLGRIAAERAPDADTGDLTSALDQIKARGYHNGARGALCARLSDAAAVDAPRLLKAVDAVLKLHEPDPANPAWCRDCTFAWPCSTYRAVTAELIKGEATP